MAAPVSNVADAVITCLRGAGVRALFGVPGGAGNLDLIAAAERAGLPFVLMATESAAAMAAGAQARISGTPGVCLTTLGPGAASVMNGVACAFLDRVPLIVFTDSQGDAARTGYEHQHLEHHAMFAPITKASMTLRPNEVDQVVGQAIRTAMSPPWGPVHVDCPGGVLSSEGGSGFSRTVAGPAEAGPSCQQEIERLISRSSRPLVIVGVGARTAADAAAIRLVCERHGVPAMVTYQAKGVVPDDHPWFAGLFTNGTIEREVVDQSDLLIGVGLDPVELLPRPWPYTAPIVYAGPWPVGRTHVPFVASAVGEIALTITQAAAVPASTNWNQAELRATVDRGRAAIRLPAAGLAPYRVVELAAERFAGHARVTVDAGAHMLPATILWPAAAPHDLLISNGLATMGFALPSAIGAALLDRERKVVALTGDGGLLMCPGELLTAVRERLPIVVIVFNDASLSLIEIKQQARKLAPAGVAIGEVNWTALAASVGMPAVIADDEAALARALDAAADADGPILIDARIDPSRYPDTMHAIRG